MAVRGGNGGVPLHLLLKQDAQVHDWASKGTSLGGRARLSSWLFSLLRCKMSLILPKRLYSVTTQSSYDWSFQQSELSKAFNWKDQSETPLEKFIKETRKETRKNRWQRQQGNSGKHQVRRSTPRSGRRMKEYSGLEARSIFPGMRTYGDKWSPCVMTRKLWSTLDTGKHQSQYLGTTGGLKCLGTLDNTLAPITSALEQS